MRNSFLALLPILAFHGATAAPYDIFRSAQNALAGVRGYPVLASEGEEVGVTREQVVKLLGRDDANLWVDKGKRFVEQSGVTYELFSTWKFSNYQLRLTSPTLCDPTVKQHSGYLDITDGKHLFFWFFESRTNPAEAPLILWLNGGPGCSSTTGLLFELGPCRIQNEGNDTSFNPSSWNNNANIIFLDQPVNVGYSYTTDGSKLSSSAEVGKDVYAFLQIFFARFPEYSKLPFHIAAESYGGTYAPNIASEVHRRNKELASSKSDLLSINLASVILANGNTEPYTQFAAIPEYGCDGPFPVFDPQGPECASMRNVVPECQRLSKACYDSNEGEACKTATLFCNEKMFAPFSELGINPYDVRLKCDPEKDGELCYEQLPWVDTWMNNDTVKQAVGAQSDLTFKSCNPEVGEAFVLGGDGGKNSAALLPELLEDGVRLLVYAGNADFVCNYIGNENWMLKLENMFHDEFNNYVPQDWVSFGQRVGRVRTAGPGAGNYTFIEVANAGHMVPHDQPEAALDLITKWIQDIPLAHSV